MRRLLVILLGVAGLALFVRGAVPCDVIGDQPECLVALHPGPTGNTLDMIAIGGEPTFESEGELLLTTVTVDTSLSFSEWVQGSFSSRVHQVPRESVFPEGKAEDEVGLENAAEMQDSQMTAAVAALRAIGRGADVQLAGALVVAVEGGSAADGVLRPGDVVVRVDQQPIDDATLVRDLVLTRGPGDQLDVGFERDGEQFDVTLVLGANETGEAFVGVELRQHVDLPIDVEIDAGNIGGPSAGLMFALAVIDVLSPEDLTGGRVIAGTGTIDADGNVGGIGGVPQKVLSSTIREADQRPAEVFLVPRGNFDSASGAPVDSELLLVPISTLDEALDALRALREGRDPAGALALAP